MKTKKPKYYVTCKNGHRYRGQIVTAWASRLLNEKQHSHCKICKAEIKSEEGIVDGKVLMGAALIE